LRDSFKKMTVSPQSTDLFKLVTAQPIFFASNSKSPWRAMEQFQRQIGDFQRYEVLFDAHALLN
jgi:hypothetical protein